VLSEKLIALFADMIFVSQSVFFMTFETKCMAILSHVFSLQQAKVFFSSRSSRSFEGCYVSYLAGLSERGQTM